MQRFMPFLLALNLSAWLAQNAIQEWREACGGHGSLAGASNIFDRLIQTDLSFFFYIHVPTASGLGNVREDNDANTYVRGR